jgi:hypothetical protein
MVNDAMIYQFLGEPKMNLEVASLILLAGELCRNPMG